MDSRTQTPPRSPFSTPLSGSAKEAELRIRSIFQWKKKRPPLWLLGLTAALCLLCGSLVSCRDAAPIGPIFTGTGAETESVPFADLLGFAGTVTRTLTETGVERYTYQAVMEDGISFPLARCTGSVYHLDLDGDGQLELVEAFGALLTVWSQRPDGSVVAQQLSQSAADLLGLEGDAIRLVDLTFQPEEAQVVIQPVTGPARTVPLEQLLSEADSGQLILPASRRPLPEHTAVFFWEGLDLDGRGGADDRAVITTREPWSGAEGSTLLEVTLGTGERLTWEWDRVGVWPRVLPARLEPGRPQSLVVELEDGTSNYSGVSYFILEVKEGALVQRGCLGSGSYTEDDLLPEELLVSGAQLLSLPDGCQVVRVPVLYDKWHDYIWGTLAPEGEGLSFTSDGCFTDYLSLHLADGRELTLALHCTVSSPHLSEQTYDQIQIWDGDTLLQTIDPYTLPADPASPFAGYSLYFHPSADIRDLNFDGSQDFGLIFDTSLYGTRCWFVWDEETEQYTYLAALGDRLTLQPELEQLTVELPNADFSALVPHCYAYDAQGALAAVS